jgi:hypothetical protein
MKEFQCCVGTRKMEAKTLNPNPKKKEHPAAECTLLYLSCEASLVSRGTHNLDLHNISHILHYHFYLHTILKSHSSTKKVGVRLVRIGGTCDHSEVCGTRTYVEPFAKASLPRRG